MITGRDEEMINILVDNQRINIQAAAYTAYVEMTPSNKKPISQREFHQKFNDNWKIFRDLEGEE